MSDCDHMSMPHDHIAVVHGNLTVSVPRSLFIGSEAVPHEPEVKRFRKMISERYPWLSENALDVLMKNAREKMLKVIDEETGGRARAKTLMDHGKVEEAVRHLEKHLKTDPCDADTWYMLGEALCKIGRTQEGYAAISKGRKLRE